MTDFNGRCPHCDSDNIDVEDATCPAWGNNDEAYIDEDWICNDCGMRFSTHSKVEVVHRKLTPWISWREKE